MQAAMAKGQLTSRELVAQYLTRLGLYEDRLNAALYVNPRHFGTDPALAVLWGYRKERQFEMSQEWEGAA